MINFSFLRELKSYQMMVQHLYGIFLYQLVRLIEKECPLAIEDLDNEKLRIKVETIDKRTFAQINQ